MEVKDYLLLEHLCPIEFDFSNDGVSPESEYCKLDNVTNTLEKFFAYMGVGKTFMKNMEKKKVHPKYTSVQDFAEKYKPVPDPDSESKLLQEIYKILWHDEQLKECKEGKIIKGDTLNSQNTTLDALYRLIETEDERKERGRLKLSILYIMSRYVEDKELVKDRLEKIIGLRISISRYHTLGNFMPVPLGCNRPRGSGQTQDYWDLALKNIYDYYIVTNSKEKDDKKDDRIIKNIIAPEEKKERYKKWLDSFEKPKWNNFVKKNYLQDFVNIINEENDDYGEPKELWKGHFSGEVLPTKMDQIEQFYVNTSSWIRKRSKRMLETLIQKCSK